MAQAETLNHTPARVSYWFILGIIVLVGWLHLATPLLAILFAYLALAKLNFFKRFGKSLPVMLFLVVLAAVSYGLGWVINQAVQTTLPEIGDRAVPLVIEWAKKHNIELPFTDFDSLKDVASETVKNQVHYLGSVAKVAR